MAKKSMRELRGLRCTVCKRLNYTTQKNRVNTQDVLKLSKFCPSCREVTEHEETKKLD